MEDVAKEAWAKEEEAGAKEGASWVAGGAGEACNDKGGCTVKLQLVGGAQFSRKRVVNMCMPCPRGGGRCGAVDSQPWLLHCADLSNAIRDNLTAAAGAATAAAVGPAAVVRPPTCRQAQRRE